MTSRSAVGVAGINSCVVNDWLRIKWWRRQNFNFNIALVLFNSLCSIYISSLISRAVLLTTKRKVAFTNFNGCTMEQRGMWKVEPVLRQDTIKVHKAPLNTLSRIWSVTLRLKEYWVKGTEMENISLLTKISKGRCGILLKNSNIL